MEGLYIPFLKLFDQGVANETLFEMIRANTRLPVDTVGDIYSLANCNEIGCSGSTEMMDEFGLDDLDELAEYICERSEAAVRERISGAAEWLLVAIPGDDGYDEPIDAGRDDDDLR